MSSETGLRDFFLVTLGLFLARVVIGLAGLPPAVAAVLAVVATVAFVGLPVFAIFRAASHPWSAPSAIAALAGGVLAHAGSTFLLQSVLPRSGVGTVFVQSLAQAGLAVWTLGLGALLSLLIREKNLLPPVAIFLAGFDAFLIFNPTSVTTQLMQQRPEFFESVAMSVPAPQVAQAGAEAVARIEPLAYVGPADLFLTATFFVCLFRFDMRVRETARLLVPVLVVYLALVLLPTGVGALPALVPIGLTVLLVNFREFRLNAEERAATLGVAALSLALAGFGVYRGLTHKPPALPAGPSPSEGVRVPPAPEGSPTRAEPSQPR